MSNESLHDSNYLFACLMNPILLTPISRLWRYWVLRRSYYSTALVLTTKRQLKIELVSELEFNIHKHCKLWSFVPFLLHNVSYSPSILINSRILLGFRRAMLEFLELSGKLVFSFAKFVSAFIVIVLLRFRSNINI